MIISADGVTLYNELTDISLRSLAAFSEVTAAAEDGVAGFGAFKEILFELNVASVSLAGGSGPTAQLKAWVQRKTPAGQWDDLLGFLTAALANGADPVYHLAEYRRTGPAMLTPALVQDAGGSPPFAARGGWISDTLRVKALLITTGTPTSTVVSWSLAARGRP